VGEEGCNNLLKLFHLLSEPGLGYSHDVLVITCTEADPTQSQLIGYGVKRSQGAKVKLVYSSIPKFSMSLPSIILLRVSWEASLYRGSLLGNSSVARHPAPT
jgi:hypothetical protein